MAISVTSDFIGERLAKARKITGLTQEEVAKILQVKREMISYWENGKRTIDSVNLVRLANLYGYSLEDLLETDSDIGDLQLGFRAENLTSDDKITVARVKKLLCNYAALKEMVNQGDDWI